MDVKSYQSGFFLQVTGTIDAIKMPGYDNLYLKYSLTHGTDWQMLSGVEHAITQISRVSQSTSAALQDVHTFNYPLDLAFKAQSVHGWPQLVLAVYGLTPSGADVLRGYACLHLPLQPGHHVRYAHTYRPVSSSLFQRFTSYLTNSPPEFFDSAFIAQGKGREVTRVTSHDGGVVKLTLNVATRRMTHYGYQVSGERTTSVPSSLETQQQQQQQQPPPMNRQPSATKQAFAQQSPLQQQQSQPQPSSSGFQTTRINPLDLENDPSRANQQYSNNNNANNNQNSAASARRQAQDYANTTTTAMSPLVAGDDAQSTADMIRQRVAKAAAAAQQQQQQQFQQRGSQQQDEVQSFLSPTMQAQSMPIQQSPMQQTPMQQQPQQPQQAFSTPIASPSFHSPPVAGSPPEQVLTPTADVFGSPMRVQGFSAAQATPESGGAVSRIGASGRKTTRLKPLQSTQSEAL